MQEVLLRDQLGMIIGRISTDYKGVLTLRSSLGEVLGTYDPKTNLTRTFLGQVVGTGNLLSMLIKR